MADTNGENIQNNENNVDDSNEYNSDADEDDYTVFDYKVHQKLKQNDPTITKIDVQLNYNEDRQCYFNFVNWIYNGDWLSNNIHLKGLRISYHGRCLGRSHEQPYILGEVEGNKLPTRQKIRAFFSCIYRNSSIKHVEIYNCCIVDEFGAGLIEGLCGHSSLTRLDIELGYNTIDQSRLGITGCTALGKILKHSQSKLKDLHLRCKLDDNGLGILCDGLLGNSTLKRLCLDGNDQITSVGWRALSTVILHTNCQLIHLQLCDTGINDERAGILGSALRCSSVKALDLSYNRTISIYGWQSLLNKLSQTPTETLKLGFNRINDDGVAGLARIGALKSLDLCSNKAITPSGWRSFFNSLQTRRIQLKTLDISFNRIGNEGVAALGGLLSHISSLKTLKMFGISQNDVSNRITAQGWQTFFNTLQDSNLDLSRLDLGGHNNIDDDSIQHLIPLLSRMSSLKHLSLSENEVATPSGWQALTGYLQSPNFAVDNNINDDTVVAFSTALAHNRTLECLDLFGCCDEDDNELITERGWSAVSTLVCNKRSIIDTYNSNHTLNYVSNSDDDEVYCLKLNYNKDKVEVARQKILLTHFSTDESKGIQEFLDMDLEVMPTVIAWMGRPVPIDWTGKKVSGLSTMFNLIRRVPDLFDASPQRKVAKRKRDV